MTDVAPATLPHTRFDFRGFVIPFLTTSLSFAIPTCRLRDVGETVEQYDEHFWRNGHAPTLVVFDDSSGPKCSVKFTPAKDGKFKFLIKNMKGDNTVTFAK